MAKCARLHPHLGPVHKTSGQKRTGRKRGITFNIGQSLDYLEQHEAPAEIINALYEYMIHEDYDTDGMIQDMLNSHDASNILNILNHDEIATLLMEYVEESQSMYR